MLPVANSASETALFDDDLPLTPNGIPISLRPCFQEYTLEKLDPERDAFTVIERTLARGDRQHVADAGQRTQAALDGMGPHPPLHPNLAGPELRPAVDQSLQRSLQFLPVPAQREAEFDIDDGPLALESDGFHSFGFV